MSIQARGLAVRLSLYLAGALALFLSVYGLWATRQSRSQLEGTVIQSADRVSDVILRSTRSFMFRNERREVHEIIQAIGTQPGFDRIRIYDKFGAVSYSTDSTEVGSTVDKQAEACIHCHRGDRPVPLMPQSERFRVFRSDDGHRVLGMITPIENEPACSQAPCHVHPASQRILGVLDTQLSLRTVDVTLERHTRTMIVAWGLTLAATVILSTFMLYRLVHRPVKRLIKGTQRIASGDLTWKIPIHANNELGDLAASFNRMTDELADARAQAETWASTLERRVEEKSRALERVQSEVLQMEKMVSLGKLAAIVAHEINNPLAGIRTYAALLRKRLARRAVPDGGGSAASQGEDAAILAQIESEAARCGEIVKNLLQFSRPSRPKAELTDLTELVRGTVRLVQHQIDLKAIRADVSLMPETPAVVCDPQQIRQALVAVLINAIEAVSQEGAIRVTTRADAGSGVVVEVADNGPGMDEETRKHIFEPFYTTKEGGAGLGLAVVFGIIRSHGGKIEVESGPGSGTTVRFHLPPQPPPGDGDGETAA